MNKVNYHLKIYTVLIIGLTLLLFILTAYGQIIWSLILLSVILKVMSDRSQVITDAFLEDTSDALMKLMILHRNLSESVEDMKDQITLLEIQITKLHENSNSNRSTKLDSPI